MGFEIAVVGLSGPVCTVTAEGAWTGLRLKKAIEQAAGVPVEEQRLLVDAAELGDHEELRGSVGKEPAGVTMVRRQRIRLGAGASAAEWFALYVYEYGQRPHEPTTLSNFVNNRGGRLTYAQARAAIQQFVDLSVPLADLPSAPPPPPAAAKPATGPVARGRRPGSPTNLEARYLEVGGLAAGEVCAVCLEEGGGSAVELLCDGRHRFHRACIEAWLPGLAATGSTGAARTAISWSYTAPAPGAGGGGAAAPNGRAETNLSQSRCPVCRGQVLGKRVQARSSGVFASRPAASRAHASRSVASASWLTTWG